MGTISSGIGLVSGLNTSAIIDSLLSIDSGPKTQLTAQINAAGQQKSAYTDLQTQLTALQTTATSLQNPLTFGATTATSSDPNVLTATTSAGAAAGSYQFQVAQLVSSQQSITQGFADTNNAKVGAGTITITQGGGELTQPTNLSDLNGGAGVERGQIRITDRSGKSNVIDLSNALTLEDVVKKINTAVDIHVKASIGDSGLTLTDTSRVAAGSDGALTVEDIGNTTTAEDLGIAGSPATAGATTLTGSAIDTVGTGTALAALNDGRGIRHGATGGGADFRVVAGDGSSFDVSLTGTEKTLGDVLDDINKASGGKVKADIAPGSSGIRLTDNTGGGSVGVSALGDSLAAKDLGIDQFSNSGTLNGSPLVAGLGTVLLSSLNGGQGLNLGSLSIRDRSGGAAEIDLSGAKTVTDVLNLLNDPSNNLGVKASLNQSGSGISITDTSGGTGALTIGDAGGGTTAEALGLAGSYDPASGNVVNGTSLHRQFVSENTKLADYNGGKGVAQGKFKITAANGASEEIDLSSGNFTTIGQVLSTINARQLGVTASINSTGDGIALTDTTGGAGALTVADESGTAASDLNIAGTAPKDAQGHATAVIDGTFTKTLDVTANDTLQTVQTKLNALGAGVTASIINDGSSAAGYRLSLSANNTGRDGRFVFDAGTTGLATQNLVNAQNAAVFVGGSGAAKPLLVTSSQNQLTNVIKGVTINLEGVSTSPVSLTVTPSSDALSKSVQGFTDGFNALVDKINTLTKWDSTTNTGGILLGDSTAQEIQADLYNMLSGVVKGVGKYTTLADVGLTIGDGAKLTFNADKFNSAFAADPTSVQKLFTTAKTGVATLMQKQINKLIDPVSGVITLENTTIDNRTQDYNTRLTLLNQLLDQKKTRLQSQFANMESVLSGLQSQQQALGSLGSITAAAPKAANLSGVGTGSSSGG